jgi:ABC-2 type transport system permease protein
MRGYLAVFTLRVKTLLCYRIAALAGIFTQLFWGFVLVMILQAFYKNSSLVEPLSLNQAMTFVWISQALLGLLPWSLDKEMSASIRSGTVVYELIRPLHLYPLFFIRSLAMRLTPALLRSLPIFLFGTFAFDLPPPVSLAFFPSLLLALFLATAISTWLLISLFWTLSGEGLQRFVLGISGLFSGLVIPLPLFPSYLQPFFNVQPFRGLMDIPSRIYTGVISSPDIPYYLAFQLIWALIFILLGHLMLRRALKRLVIQGG